ncbi:O-antigen/teichoic acid export membrane protein [Idiomarina sp. 017G]|nr:O-antigen/teichoic acid export membrane protein [Idiomarina sp. 017G]
MLQVTLSFGVLLFSLGLDQAYVREFHERENKPALLKQASFPGLVLLILTLLGLLCFGGVISELLFGISAVHLSLLVALALLASFISRFLSLVLRMNERGLAYSMSQLLPKLLLVVLVGLYVLLEADKTLTNLVLATTASFVTVTLVFAWNTRDEWLKAIPAPFDLSEVKSLLRFGLPLILGGLAFWGLTALDKVFLRTLSSFEELAVYSVSVSFAAAATIFQSVFSTVWAPTVYKWASSGKGLENVEKTTRFVLAIVVLLFCLVGLFSWIVTYFLPPAYKPVQWIVVSCLGFPLLYMLSETTVVGIGISRRSSFAMLAALIAFGVNVIGNLWLIPLFGAKGAAVSTCVSFLFFFILRTEFSIYLWRKIHRGTLYTYTTFSVSLACTFTLYGEVLSNLMTIAWIVLVLASFVSFRREYISVFKFICEKSKIGIAKS